MTNEQQISMTQAMTQIAAELTEAISFDEFAERVLAIWPSSAKQPKQSIRQHFSYSPSEYGVVFIDDKRKTVMPLRSGMRGIRLRHVVTEPEVASGFLRLMPGEYMLLGRRMYRENMLQEYVLLDSDGQRLPAKPAELRYTEDTLLGEHEVQAVGFQMKEWFAAHDMQVGDSVIWVIEDWMALRFMLEHEPAANRRAEEITVRNQELANLLYHMLEHSRSESLDVSEDVPAALMRLRDPQGYPGDPWEIVVRNDPRMTWTGNDIHYASEEDTFLDLLLAGEASVAAADAEAATAVESLSPAVASRVYQFKCAMKQRKGLWRMIQIKGEQTLTEFNRILVSAFQHEEWDHMGGFWQRVRRGNTKRFREVEMGTVDPFGGGDGADRQIGEFELEIGDEIKYVFDFGDWHEYRLTLVDTIEAEHADPDVDYPRVVQQNRPRYRYCGHCKDAAKKTVAKYICVDCSDAEQQQVLVCEDCATELHEDHYIDKIIY